MSTTTSAGVVETSSGPLSGRRIATPDGDVEALLGVPFARFAGRFRPGEPAVASSSILDAGTFGPGAPQEPARVTNFVVDEARCLNANVWRPTRPSSSKRPVLVWVHGGGHLYGSNTNSLCDGGRLAAFGDMVVVAGNYRLGALGYLRLEHLLGKGFQDSQNLAMLDLVELLEWVSTNAEVFGGDPSNVTVMGQSAGAVMAATLLAMPRAAGLFQRLIIESGSAERVASFDEAGELTRQVLAETGCGSARNLLTLPWRQLVAAQERVIAHRSTGRPNLDLAFRPTLDERNLKFSPLEAVRLGHAPNADLIIGTNVNEASGFVDLGRSDAATRHQFETQAALLLPGLSAKSAEEYRSALDADTGKSNSDAEALESCMADLVYRQPTQRLLDARRTVEANTRAYLFAWERPGGTWIRRAGHSLELPYVFRHVDDSDDALNEVGPNPALLLRARMSSAWSAFASDGSPQEWGVYGSERTTLVLNNESSTVTDPRASIRELVARASN